LGFLSIKDVFEPLKKHKNINYDQTDLANLYFQSQT